MKAGDFADQTEAEKKLIAHLREGKVGPCKVGEATPPENAASEFRVRSSLIRALMVGKLADVPLPERGLQLFGAYIVGDGPTGGETAGLDLEGATVAHNLVLSKCYFPDLIVVRDASLRNLSLDGSYLAAGLQANQLETNGSVVLRDITSMGEIELVAARISSVLDCSKSVLKETSHALSADGAVVTGNVVLDGIISAGEIRLLGASVGGDLDCEGAILRGMAMSLNCDGAVIEGRWFWRNNASATGKLVFIGAEIGSVVDDPACFPREILLDRCRYGAFIGKGVNAADRIDWLSRTGARKVGPEFWPQPYEECARALREAGYGTDARIVLIEKERLQRAARDRRLARDIKAEQRPYAKCGLWLQRWLSRVGDMFLSATVAYGRRPLQAVIPLLGFLLVGANIFLMSAGLDQIKPNLPQIQRAAEWTGCRPPEGSVSAGERWEEGDSQVACFLRQPEAASYPRFDAMIYSADTLLPIVSLEMQSYWIPDDRKPLGRLARLYLWLHIFSGWGLTLLAVAGFSGLIKTDNSK